MVKHFAVWFIGSILLCAQPVQVTVKSDSMNYMIGDHIPVNIQVTFGQDTKFAPPAPKDILKPLEFVSIQSIDTVSTEAGRQTLNMRLVYTAFDSGVVKTDSVKILYQVQGDTAIHTTASRALDFIISVIPVDTAAAIKDLKEPQTEPLNWWLIAAIALAAVAAGVAIYYLIRKWRRAKQTSSPEPEAPVLSPYDEAFSRLRELDEKQLWQRGDVKEYHSEITEIVRNYFERSLDFPALELTSGETISYLKERSVRHEMICAAEEFFESADMVKFAKFIPMPSVNIEMMKQAYQLISLGQLGITHPESKN
jgi:hypothetical protein